MCFSLSVKIIVGVKQKTKQPQVCEKIKKFQQKKATKRARHEVIQKKSDFESEKGRGKKKFIMMLRVAHKYSFKKKNN